VDPDVVAVTLGPHDRRFGFSVVGGKEEGFPPRIDEIAKGIYLSLSLYLDLCCYAKFFIEEKHLSGSHMRNERSIVSGRRRKKKGIYKIPFGL